MSLCVVKKKREERDISVGATPLASHWLDPPKGATGSDVVDARKTEQVNGQSHNIGTDASGHGPSAKTKLFDSPVISQGGSQGGFGASKLVWDDADFTDASDEGEEDDGDAGAYGLPCRRSLQPRVGRCVWAARARGHPV